MLHELRNLPSTENRTVALCSVEKATLLKTRSISRRVAERKPRTGRFRWSQSRTAPRAKNLFLDAGRGRPRGTNPTASAFCPSRHRYKPNSDFEYLLSRTEELQSRPHCERQRAWRIALRPVSVQRIARRAFFHCRRVRPISHSPTQYAASVVGSSIADGLASHSGGPTDTKSS